ASIARLRDGSDRCVGHHAFRPHIPGPLALASTAQFLGKNPHLNRMDLPISSPHSAGSNKVTWFDVRKLALLHPEDFRISAQRERLFLSIWPCDRQRSAIKLLYCTRDPDRRAICRALRKHRSSRKSDSMPAIASRLMFHLPSLTRGSSASSSA